MIHKLKGYIIKPLTRISASQYHSALSCPFKIVLANAFGYEQLLPLNANAHFGSISHKMIELISKGVILDDQTFLENWHGLVTKKEEELKQKGLSNITPLKYYVTDFALKKNQIKNILNKKKDKINKFPKASSSKYFAEFRLENTDKTVIGVADLIIENDFGSIILDFKTGKIYSDQIDESNVEEQIIKKEYEIQLKLYAHLYYLKNNKYPTSLYLVTLSNDFVEVKFSKLECEKTYLDALSFISETNSFIEKSEFNEIAKPSSENCKYCSYRPACNYYSKWLVNNFETVNDMIGVIEKVTRFNNNSLGLQLLTTDQRILINGFSTEFTDEFEKKIGNNIVLYNLRKTKQSLNATANNYTTVYEYN